MPTYSDTTITISGQRISWNRLSNRPVEIRRLLDTLVDLRLLSHRILTGRTDLTGVGVATIEQTETITKQYPAERVGQLGEYPKTLDTPGPITSARTDKWGFEEDIPDELVSRATGGDTVARKLLKMVNQHVTQNDARALSAIGSSITATFGVTSGAWNTSGADPFADLLLAAAQVDELNKGYNVNTLVVKPTTWAQILTKAKVIDRAPREGGDPLLLTGRLARIAGYDIWKSTNLPSGVDALAFDRDMLGGIGWEDIPTQEGAAWVGSARPAAPGDTDPTAGVQVRRRSLQSEGGKDGIAIGSRLVQVPYITEPGAGVKITGVLS
jgi:hypothetical protein